MVFSWLPNKITSAAIPGLFLIALGSGCESNENKYVVSPGGESAYQAASCAYGYDEGGEVDLQIAETADEQTVYFGKTLNFAPIHAVMGASAKNTVEYFATQNVRINQIPKSVSRCNIFESLPVAPQDFRDFWESISTGIDGIIVGLYIEKHSSELPSAEATSEIGIRKDANRWVAIHEFMHHQFQSLRTRNRSQSADQLKILFRAETENYQSAKKQFESNPTAETLRLYAQTFAAFDRDLRELQLRFPLEEVTIETLMQKLYSNFKYLPLTHQSSDNYIASSAGSAIYRIQSANDGASTILKEADKLNLKGDFIDAVSLEINANDELLSQLELTLKDTDIPVRRNHQAALIETGSVDSHDKRVDTSYICANGSLSQDPFLEADRALNIRR